MAKFIKKLGSETPGISTASLPDIIFMLLFFFMVTTVMREVTLMILVAPPDASEVQKLEDKSLVNYLYVGVPHKRLQDKMGEESRIQVNDAFSEISAIKNDVTVMLEKLPEHKRSKRIVAMKVDQNTKMGIISDLKQELRKANALKINYSTKKGYDAQK